jgi:hypothetical protein
MVVERSIRVAKKKKKKKEGKKIKKRNLKYGWHKTSFICLLYYSFKRKVKAKAECVSCTIFIQQNILVRFIYACGSHIHEFHQYVLLCKYCALLYIVQNSFFKTYSYPIYGWTHMNLTKIFYFSNIVHHYIYCAKLNFQHLFLSAGYGVQ